MHVFYIPHSFSLLFLHTHTHTHTHLLFLQVLAMLTDRAQSQEQQLLTLQKRVTVGKQLEQEARLGQEQATACRQEAEVCMGGRLLIRK